MDRASLPGNPPVEIQLRRSPQARRYTLRVSGFDGRVTLTLPRRGTLAAALAFAREREGWIRSALSRQEEPERIGPGSRLPVSGSVLTVTPADVRACRSDDGLLLVPRDGGSGARVAAFLKAVARRELGAATARHAAALGRPAGRITLRDTRSRWGSCSHRGDLMYSWRLAMAPPEVLDYVAAHEVAHLAEMNHSPAFWAIVARLCPDHARHRRWLRREGGALHRFRFDD
jgi:predicted metal-dependent hydrolase